MLIENPMKVSTEEHASDEIKLSDIHEPHHNDVLMGRGGKNNQHVGNEQLRSIARGRNLDYQNASKKGKSMISRELVEIVRNMKPPGRFLRKDSETNTWEDVGNDIAREKTSQVLRDAVAFHSAASPDSGASTDSKSLITARNDTSSFRRRRDNNAEDEREFAAILRQPDNRETRSPNYTIQHPYLSLPPPQPVPYHLPVTPASSTEARKRPRYYESPLPSYHSTPNHYLNTPSHPLGVMLTPPPRSQAPRPTFSYYPNTPGQYTSRRHGASFVPLPLPHSVPTQNQYAPLNQPVNTDPLPIDASTSSHADFDLFDGELLSDSCGRDEFLSPITYPEV